MPTLHLPGSAKLQTLVPALRQLAVAALVLVAALAQARAGGVVVSCTEAALRVALNGGGTATFTNDCSILISHQIPIADASTIIDATGHNVSIGTSNSVPLFAVSTNLTLRGLVLVNGTSASAGGALYINVGAVVVANGCVFAGNTVVGTNGLAGVNGATNSVSPGGNGSSGTPGSSALGGAIYNLGALALVKCTLTNNNVTAGAGGSGGSGGASGGAFALGGNGGNGAGGGMGLGGAVYNLGDLTIIDCTFAANSAAGGNGGAGGAAGTGNVAGFPGNGAMGGDGSGGAVFNARNLTLLSSTFTSNWARGGAGTAGGMEKNGEGKPGLTGGQAAGGALDNDWWAAVTNCTFYTNYVLGGAGGDGGYGGGTFLVAGDGADGGNGVGGSLNNANTVTLVNCTFSSGAAIGGTNGASGSGTYAGDPGNPGVAFGGNIANSSGSLILENSILTASVSGGNAAGSFTDGGYNLSSDAVGSLGNLSFQNIDPKLAPLASYGGPTFTMALLTNSPAIDKIPSGLSPVTDQRSFTRPINHLSDIGAVEFGGAATVTNITVSIAQPSNGLVSVSATGVPGVTYFVQASTNLPNWEVVSTNVAPVLFVDPVTNSPVRFYRITR